MDAALATNATFEAVDGEEAAAAAAAAGSKRRGPTWQSNEIFGARREEEVVEEVAGAVPSLQRMAAVQHAGAACEAERTSSTNVAAGASRGTVVVVEARSQDSQQRRQSGSVGEGGRLPASDNADDPWVSPGHAGAQMPVGMAAVIREPSAALLLPPDSQGMAANGVNVHVQAEHANPGGVSGPRQISRPAEVAHGNGEGAGESLLLTAAAGGRPAVPGASSARAGAPGACIVASALATGTFVQVQPLEADSARPSPSSATYERSTMYGGAGRASSVILRSSSLAVRMRACMQEMSHVHLPVYRATTRGHWGIPIRLHQCNCAIPIRLHCAMPSASSTAVQSHHWMLPLMLSYPCMCVDELLHGVSEKQLLLLAADAWHARARHCIAHRPCRRMAGQQHAQEQRPHDTYGRAHIPVSAPRPAPCLTCPCPCSGCSTQRAHCFLPGTALLWMGSTRLASPPACLPRHILEI